MTGWIDTHISKLPPTMQQVARFILTGGVNTAFGWLVYVFFAAALDWDYLPALVAAQVLGISFSYLTFRRFVFTGGGPRSFLRFVPAYAALFAFNLGCLHLLVDRAGWGKVAAQTLAVPVCAVLSFFLNKLFVFRERAER